MLLVATSVVVGVADGVTGDRVEVTTTTTAVGVAASGVAVATTSTIAGVGLGVGATVGVAHPVMNNKQ